MFFSRYGISSEYATKFQKVTESLLPKQSCPVYWRHKSLVVKDSLLKEKEIPLYKVSGNEKLYFCTFHEGLIFSRLLSTKGSSLSPSPEPFTGASTAVSTSLKLQTMETISGYLLQRFSSHVCASKFARIKINAF